MNVLLRKVVSRSKDALLKESLQTQLVACVKDIQLDHSHSGQFQSSFETTEAFCTVLEAIFIHGIKETLADKMAIAIGDPDSRPEPNFWPALLVFSHREIIDQIGKLNFVSTDVGRCRAWLRMALNESLLSSYLQSMLAQNSALNSFYKRAAYLRDKELLDMFITLVSGIEGYPFNLVCNSSLLNLWTNQPLLMSGVWSPAMKSCPITSGTDIASTLDTDDVRASDKDSLSSVASLSSFYESSPHYSAFDEDKVLKQILGADATSDEEKIFEESVCSTKRNLNIASGELVDTEEKNICSGSTDETELAADQVNNKKQLPGIHQIEREELDPSVKTKNEVKEEKLTLQSYHSLVESYNQASSKIPDLQDLLQKFQEPTKLSEPCLVENDSELDDKLDFEVVPDNFDPSDIPEFEMLIQQISRIANEHGLNSQNYICKSCPVNIGVNFREAKVCRLSGAYYCSECYGTDPTNQYWVIPARIIYNWDYRQYSVSHIAANFLSQTQLYPLFDMNAINKKIYSAVEEMTRLKDIRIRLKFLGDYLKTCRGNAFETLQRLLWPRDYMYETVHHYSLADLMQVPSGALEGCLKKAVNLARSHVVSCDYCMQKGFICEICNDLKVIFPFDLDLTYRCDACGTVYHAECLQPGQLCRKCSRIQKRQLQHTSSTQQLVSSS